MKILWFFGGLLSSCWVVPTLDYKVLTQSDNSPCLYTLLNRMAVSLLLWPGHSCGGSWWGGPATVPEVVGSGGGAMFNLPVSCLNFVDRCKAVLCDTRTFDKLWPVLPGNPRPPRHVLLMQCLPDWKMKMFHFLFKHTMFSMMFCPTQLCRQWLYRLRLLGKRTELVRDRLTEERKSMLFPFPPHITTNTVCLRRQLAALSDSTCGSTNRSLDLYLPFSSLMP